MAPPLARIVGQIARCPGVLRCGRGRVLQFALWPARVAKPDRQNHKYKRRTALPPLAATTATLSARTGARLGPIFNFGVL